MNVKQVEQCLEHFEFKDVSYLMEPGNLMFTRKKVFISSQLPSVLLLWKETSVKDRRRFIKGNTLITFPVCH